MTKLLNYLPQVAFISLLVRILVLGAGVGEAISLISLVSLIGYMEWSSKKDLKDRELLQEKFDETNKKIEELSSKMQSLTLEKSIRRQVTNDQITQAAIAASGTNGKRLF